MKVCSSCNKPNTDDSKFCMYCGEVLGESPAPAPVAAPTPKPVAAPTSESGQAPEPTPAPATVAETPSVPKPISPADTEASVPVSPEQPGESGSSHVPAPGVESVKSAQPTQAHVASSTPAPVSAPTEASPTEASPTEASPTEAVPTPSPVPAPAAHSESSLPQNTVQASAQSVATGIMNQIKSTKLPDISKVSSKVDTAKALSFVQSNKKLLAALAALIIVLICVLMYFSQSRGSLKDFEDVYGNDCPYFDTRVVIHPDIVIPKGSEVYVITTLQRSGKKQPESVANIERAKVNGDNEIVANVPMGMSGTVVALYKDAGGNLYGIAGEEVWAGCEDSEKRSEYIEKLVKAQTALTPDPTKIADFQGQQVDLNTLLQERILEGDVKVPNKGLMEIWAEATEIKNDSAKKAGRINLSEFGGRSNVMSIHETLEPEDIDRTFSFK